MPRNKNALIRYQVLDRCLQNHQKRFYIQDLIDACNLALSDINGQSDTKGAEKVQRRQIFDDLNFMEDEVGFGVTIERIKDGRRTYYRYAKGSKTIKDHPLKQDEIEMLHDALMLLKRFEGVPQFEWIENLESCLYSTSKLGENTESIVSFQHNPYLRGMQWFKVLFNMIINKRVIEITYHPFGKESRTLKVSPYHLKQYNNRWFLIAKHNDCIYLSNYAIDRIENVQETGDPFHHLPEGFDFEEYFSDIVGVSITNSPVEEIVLHVTNDVLGYIVTKPLHESQSTRPILQDDGRWEIRLKVQVNYELFSILRSFGHSIEIMSPLNVRNQFKDSIQCMINMYDKK